MLLQLCGLGDTALSLQPCFMFLTMSGPRPRQVHVGKCIHFTSLGTGLYSQPLATSSQELKVLPSCRDGAPYCEKDYQGLFGVKCEACQQFITGKVLEVSGMGSTGNHCCLLQIF